MRKSGNRLFALILLSLLDESHERRPVSFADTVS
jgi:hypothetical protein